MLELDEGGPFFKFGTAETFEVGTEELRFDDVV